MAAQLWERKGMLQRLSQSTAQGHLRDVSDAEWAPCPCPQPSDPPRCPAHGRCNKTQVPTLPTFPNTTPLAWRGLKWPPTRIAFPPHWGGGWKDEPLGNLILARLSVLNLVASPPRVVFFSFLSFFFFFFFFFFFWSFCLF